MNNQGQNMRNNSNTNIDENHLKELKKMQHIQQQSTPLCLTKAFVEKPCLVIIICTVVYIFCLILSIGFNLFAQSEAGDREWSVWSSQKTIDNDILNEAIEQFKKGSDEDQTPERSEEVEGWGTMIMLECYEDDENQCDNALQGKFITALYELENKIKSHKDYKKFCLASFDSSECSEEGIISITNIFNEIDLHDKKISETELQNKLDLILNNEIAYQQYSYLFGKEFKSGNKKTRYVRTIIKFGAPIKINGKLQKNRYDNEDDQYYEFKDFSFELLDMVDDMQKDIGDKISILIFSGPIGEIEFGAMLDGDVLWALASIIFVWGYLTFHLRSFFLSSLSIFGILMTFPLTSVIFMLILQITYFSTLHVLVIFIVLGIAADDIFVFIDAWKQTEAYTILDGDFNKRMAVTFRRAAKAMLATSSTTSAAFLATGFSSIMPISSFGIYAAILIPMNYIMVITFFPALLIVYENKLKNKCCASEKSKQEQIEKLQKQKQDQTVTDKNLTVNNDSKFQLAAVNKTDNSNIINHENNNFQDQVKQTEQEKSVNQQQLPIDNDLSDKKIQPSYQITIDNKQQQIPELKQDSQPQIQIRQENTVQETKLEKFLENQYNNFIFKGRYIIIGIFLIWFGIATWQSLLLGPQTKPDQWLPDDFKMQRAITHLQDDFIQGGDTEIAIFVDLIWGVKSMNTDDTSAWDLKDVGTLNWDKDFDLSPRANQQIIYDFLNDLKSNPVVKDSEVECFMLDFKTFVENNNQVFPVPQNQFLDFLGEFAQSEEGYQYYLDSRIGFFKGKLQYISIQAKSTGDLLANYEEQQPIYDKWQKIVQDFNKDANKGMNNLIQTSGTWVWMVSQKAFVDQAIEGMLISLAFALIVLLLSTHNIIVSLYSIFSITGIVVSVVTVMQLSGWQLGVAESITIVILIGFSVDYVVHLANHYVESTYDDRYKRMQEALKEIGISILSGAITTLGSGIFLFFAVISIFNKFAVLIVATIVFSLIFSLIFFAALMHAFGPSQNQGNVAYFFNKIISKNKVSSIDNDNNNNNKIFTTEQNQTVQAQDVETQQKHNI